MRVVVFGAGGRMGAEVCRAVHADDSLDFVGAVDPYHAGKQVLDVAGVNISTMQISATANEIARVNPEVCVDFTHLEAAIPNILWCAANGVHCIVGTTGFSEQNLAEFRAAFTRSNCLIAPNFAIGAVLMMRFAEMAAPYFETAEIIEFHHDQKIDAPSGTALATVARMAAAKSVWAQDPTKKELLPGSRGSKGPGDIRVHAVRMRGMVAHQEVILGTTGQTLVIRHDTTDRTSFMPGVLIGLKKIADHPGVTIGLDSFL